MLKLNAIWRLGWTCAVSALCALAPARAARAEGTNLLQNGGFEDARGAHPWMPAAWDTSRGNTEMVFFGRDGFSAHTGQYGVSVANVSVAMPLWHNWSQSIDVTPDMCGKDLVFTVWTRSNGVAGRGYVNVQAFRDTIGKMARVWKVSRVEASHRLGMPGVNDPVTDIGWKRESFADEETGWVERTLRVYLPPTSTIVTVHGGLFGSGQVMFDDASLTLEPAAAAVVPPLHTNMLQDGGFENGALAWELSTPPFPPLIAAPDSSQSHSGKACMHFWCESGMVTGRAGVAQVFCNRALAGKRLRLTAWTRSDSLQASIFTQLFFHTRTGFSSVSSPVQVYGTSPWTEQVIEADVPKETYLVWAWIEYNAPINGHAFFDDASLEVLGPATGEPTPDPNQVHVKPPGGSTPKPATKPVAKPARKPGK